MSLPAAAWWEVRRASNRKPATYRCPLCGRHLPALTEHMLLFPEGDHRRRRHAHIECVMRARAAGTLPLREDWDARPPDARPPDARPPDARPPDARPPDARPPLWRRLLRRR